MDNVHAEQQRNFQATLLHRYLLHVAYVLHAFKIEQSTHLAARYLSGDVAALGLSGDDCSRDGEVELSDLLL